MGTLKIIIGPMYSGKTTELINDFKSLQVSLMNKKPHINTITQIAIDYKNIDNGINFSYIYSHDGEVINASLCYKLSDMTEFILVNDIKNIFINEAQFFLDLKEWVIMMLEHYKKNIVLCGLDSDFNRKKFGDIWDLIPHADTIVKKKGTCKYCECHSLFSHKIKQIQEENTEVNSQIDMDLNKYVPVCRGCYNSLNRNL